MAPKPAEIRQIYEIGILKASASSWEENRSSGENWDSDIKKTTTLSAPVIFNSLPL
jgi:hypothetical protein